MAKWCAARMAGTQRELPLKRKKTEAEFLEKTLLVMRSAGRLLLVPGVRVAGFWDLPEPFRGARVGAMLGEFKHTITHRHYRFLVFEGVASRKPAEGRWFDERELAEIPLSTTAKKALRVSI